MVRELLFSALLLGAPMVQDVGEVENTEPETSQEIAQQSTEEEKIKVVDEDGNEYWIDFNKVDWDNINIDWGNLNKDEIVDIMLDIATQAMSPELLTTILAVASIALSLIICFFKYFKERTKAKITANDCADLTLKKIDELLETLKAKNDEKLDELTAASKIQSESMIKLLKVQALAQQNTAESRKAIIDELVDSGRLDEKLAQKTTAEIDKQVKEEKEHKDSILEELENLKDDGTTI